MEGSDGGCLGPLPQLSGARQSGQHLSAPSVSLPSSHCYLLISLFSSHRHIILFFHRIILAPLYRPIFFTLAFISFFRFLTLSVLSSCIIATPLSVGALTRSSVVMPRGSQTAFSASDANKIIVGVDYGTTFTGNLATQFILS